MTDDDHLLASLARSEVPGLDQGTRDRIEAGLRVQHSAARSAPALRRPRWLLAAPALVVVLLVATVLLVVRDEAAVAALAVRDAQNVVVTLPSGDTINDPEDGYTLGDGAVIVVGDAGTITINDITLSAGATVRVRDGQLVTDVVATTTTDRPTDREPSDPEVTVTRPPTSTDSAPPADRPPDPTTPDRDAIRPPETLPPDTLPPETLPPEPPVESRPVGDHPGAPQPPRDGTGAPPDPGDLPHDADAFEDAIAVGLQVRAGDGRIRVAWNVEGVTDPAWTVLVLRTVDGSIPEHPDGAVTVGEGTHGEVLEHRADLVDDPSADPPADPVALRYRVVIVDASGGVVARSETQTVSRSDS